MLTRERERVTQKYISLMLIQVNIRRVKKLGVAILKKWTWLGTLRYTLYFITLRFAGPHKIMGSQIRSTFNANTF